MAQVTATQCNRDNRDEHAGKQVQEGRLRHVHEDEREEGQNETETVCCKTNTSLQNPSLEIRTETCKLNSPINDAA